MATSFHHDFDLMLDADGSERHGPFESIPVEGQALAEPREINAIFVRERVRPAIQTKSNKTRSDKSKMNAGKPSKAAEGSHSGLASKVQEKDMEHAPNVHASRSDGSGQETELEKGCLFAVCIRCSSVVRIKFASALIPHMSVKFDAEYTNGIVMTVCKECDDHQGSKSLPEPCSRAEIAPLRADTFRELGIGGHLLEGSKIEQAARAVAGMEVPFITYGRRLHFEERKNIQRHTNRTDAVASMDVHAPGVMSRESVLKPHLYGGFF